MRAALDAMALDDDDREALSDYLEMAANQLRNT